MFDTLSFLFSVYFSERDYVSACAQNQWRVVCTMYRSHITRMRSCLPSCVYFFFPPSLAHVCFIESHRCYLIVKDTASAILLHPPTPRKYSRGITTISTLLLFFKLFTRVTKYLTFFLCLLLPLSHIKK